jgi:hypothetical protein
MTFWTLSIYLRRQGLALPEDGDSPASETLFLNKKQKDDG